MASEKRKRPLRGPIGLLTLAVAVLLLVVPTILTSELFPRVGLPAIYIVSVAVVIFVVAALALLSQTTLGAVD